MHLDIITENYEVPADAKVGDTWSTSVSFQLCPDCLEGELVMRGHCNECLLCGWRACSISPKGN